MPPPPPFSESIPDAIVCEVGALRADLATIEVLARERLRARALGCVLLLRGASRELAELIELCGLRDVLPCELLAGGRDGGQAEEREEPRGVEERVDPRDPPV